MARKLARYEHEQGMNERDSEAHLALFDIWKIVEMLDSAIPVS